MRELIVTLPEYHHASVKPQNFLDWCDMYEAHDGPLGLWCFSLSDRVTGEVTKEIWTKNIVTDNGAISLLKNLWNNAGGAVAPMNIIALAANAGSTTLQTATTAGQAIAQGGTISVAALPAAIASGATLTIGYGGSSPQNVVTSAAAAAGNTTIALNAVTLTAAYAVGTNIVPVPTTSDNPASVAGAQYSTALAAGAFTYSGTGAGNRQVVMTFTFNGASYTAGNYTEAYTTNVNPIATGSTASHLITTPMALNSTTNLTVNITEKL